MVLHFVMWKSSLKGDNLLKVRRMLSHVGGKITCPQCTAAHLPEQSPAPYMSPVLGGLSWKNIWQHTDELLPPQFWKITFDSTSTDFIYFRCSVSSLLDMNSLKIRNLDGSGGGGFVAQSWPTLCDPMDCSLPGSSIHGILSARVLEWVAIPFSRGSSQPRDQTCVSFVSLAPPPRRCHQKPWKKLRPDQASFFKQQKSKICFLLIIKVLCNHYWKLIKKRMKKINHNPVTQKWPSILQDISSQFVCVSFPCPRIEHNIFKYFLCNITYSQGIWTFRHLNKPLPLFLKIYLSGW